MIKQIAVFLENEAGKASECCKILKDAGVNLDALTIADTKDFGILRIITAEDRKALAALRNAGHLASSVELVAVEVADKAGALADLLIVLGEAGVNVEYMYSYAESGGAARIAFKTNTPEKAVEALEKTGAKVL